MRWQLAAQGSEQMVDDDAAGFMRAAIVLMAVLCWRRTSGGWRGSLFIDYICFGDDDDGDDADDGY